MGGRRDDYFNLAPPNSYIHVDDFHSPAHLAAYLRYLDGNDTAYAAFFAWKALGSIGVSGSSPPDTLSNQKEVVKSINFCGYSRRPQCLSVVSVLSTTTDTFNNKAAVSIWVTSRSISILGISVSALESGLLSLIPLSFSGIPFLCFSISPL